MGETLKAGDRKVLLCNCERSMDVDSEALAKALGCEAGSLSTHLCRSEIDTFGQAIGDGEPVMVACTQEAPLFREFAEEAGAQAPLDFFNIREQAGWSQAKSRADKRNVTAKMAALIAEAAVPQPPAMQRTIESGGVCLVYGAGQAALEAAHKLSGRLSTSVLLTDPRDIIPPATGEVPIYTGRIARAVGSLGSFEITVDGYAPMIPSSRSEPEFLMARDGATAECDLILDLSGGTPMFTGADKRDGYFRVDPGSPVALAEAMFAITDYVGTFEKPVYIDYNPDICAHSRSSTTGCSNCLDVCPAGAITSAGDTVSIDAGICGGCGNCSAVCPTGAASYTFPTRDALIARIQALVGTYLTAGGSDPVVLVHDQTHGSEIIAAMARFGRGLPGNVLPLAVYATGTVGHDMLAAAFSAGAARVVVLSDPKRPDDFVGLEPQAEIANAVLDGLGLNAQGRIEIIDEADPDAVEARLHDATVPPAIAQQSFAAVGSKREVARAALNALREAAPEQPDVIALPDHAPYGRIVIDTEGCTLCLACVSACPAGALFDNPEKPQVRLQEQACVQCGLCAATCPESVITLDSRLDFTPAAFEQSVLVEEEPFECVRCGKPFGSRRAVERVSEQLAGKHWMFAEEGTADVFRMCDDCRIQTMSERGDNPFQLNERPRTITTDDYLKAREEGIKDDLSLEDFLK